MQPTNSTGLSCARLPYRSGWLLLCAMMLTMTISAPGYAADKRCRFMHLDEKEMQSHILHRVAIDSPLLGTISAHTTIPILACVDEKGLVISAKASGKANPMLQSLVEKAVAQWKFR